MQMIFKPQIQIIYRADIILSVIHLINVETNEKCKDDL